MISFNDSNIIDILPESLSDNPKTKALGYAVSMAIKRLSMYLQNISVYAAIDSIPENLLDLLAVELNTQYYDAALKIDKKRSLVKGTLVWYMYTGTPAAVEEVAEAVFGNSEVKEWFDYGGEPYHFKIYTANINTTDEKIEQVTNLVSRMQNARSYLEAVIVEVMQRLYLYHGCVIQRVSDVTTIGIDMEMYIDRTNFLAVEEDEEGNTVLLVDDSGNAIIVD